MRQQVEAGLAKFILALSGHRNEARSGADPEPDQAPVTTVKLWKPITTFNLSHGLKAQPSGFELLPVADLIFGPSTNDDGLARETGAGLGSNGVPGRQNSQAS